MNLIEALDYVQRPFPENADCITVFLVCGSTPLHLGTFLTAHLRKLRPDCRIEVKCGLFGDLIGNVERLRPEQNDAIMIVIEWSDLDSRLGLRRLGGWHNEKLPDITRSVKSALTRLGTALRSHVFGCPVYVCLPTLPFPPLSYMGTQVASTFELNLRASIALFAEEISNHRRVRVVSSQYLDEHSSLSTRYDLRTEISQGFPYSISHACVLGEHFAALICQSEPKKGLITDLDNTLWAGILGELGVDGIGWDIDRDAQLHGIYQQFLASLASYGILIAAASKNEPALVQVALKRRDLLISRDTIFPIEAHWGRKSESVNKILNKWNVLPESVIFIDDSPMEIAEVQASFPEMECLLFPKNNYGELWKLLIHLRNQFAKTQMSEEDSLRMQSIRASEVFREGFLEQSSMDSFLEEAQGALTFVTGNALEDRRAFELVNKTNQFNLNGKRFDDKGWSTFFSEPGAYAITVSYEDKFGKLGKIAVMMGRLDGRSFLMNRWVMSCRAFSRRIEYHCLSYIFERFDVSNIAFEVQATGRNGPLLQLFREFAEGPVEANFLLNRSRFLTNAPKLPHNVTEEVLAQWKID